MNATATAPDWWQLFDLDYGREIPCSSAPRLLAFLLSPGTRNANIGWRNPKSATIKVVVYGPVADDFEFLNTSYVLSAREVRDFSEEEQRLMLTRLRELWGSPSGPNHPLILFRHTMGLS